MAEKDCIEMGHCALHGQEVERRREVKRELEELDEKYDQKVGDLWKHVGYATNFRGQAKVVGIVASLIFASSFIYTRSHIAESNLYMKEMQANHIVKIEAVKSNSEREFDKIQRMVDSNESSIDNLETRALLMDQRLKNIETSTNRIEQRLSQLVSILADSGEITPRDKYKWDYQPENGGFYDEQY